MRQLARNAALILFAALGAYLLSLPLSARLALLFAKSALSSPLGAVLLALLALDLSKLPTLLLMGWLFGRGVTLSPASTAAALVATTYALEVGVSLLLDETRWMKSASVLLARAAAMFVLIFVTRLVIKRAAPAREVAAAADTRDTSNEPGDSDAR
ncbi:MAG: hypothetical protein KC503_23295 [Myxococcales bacterium]|nr:hypothetical protein [Myxococcales bacterium]